MKKNLPMFASNSLNQGMGVFNMDKTNQLAANATFFGTNNSAVTTTSGTTINGVGGGSGGGGSTIGASSNSGGFFNYFFTGPVQTTTAVIGSGGGGGLGSAGINDNSATLASNGQDMRDFNVWMPQSM